MKVKECPKCGSTDLGNHWVKDRKLRQYCADCNWMGDSRTPERLKIETSAEIDVNQFPGFHYEVFDQYGHVTISSQSYDTEAEALQELLEDLNQQNSIPNYGPCTGLLWPATVVVKATVIKAQDE